MKELGLHERRLLDALRVADEPTAADRARVRSGTLSKLGAVTGLSLVTATALHAAGATGTAATATGSAASVAAATGTFASLVGGPLKVGLVLAALGAAAGGVYGVARSATDTERRDVSAATPAAEVKADPRPARTTEPVAPMQQPPVERLGGADSRTQAPALAPSKAPDKRAQTAERPHSQRRQQASDDLDDEVKLLGAAHQALSQGDTSRTLRLLARHQALYPSGALSVERSGLHAIALCQSAKREQGKLLAARFVRNHPHSTLVARVRTACDR